MTRGGFEPPRAEPMRILSTESSKLIGSLESHAITTLGIVSIEYKSVSTAGTYSAILPFRLSKVVGLYNIYIIELL